MKYANHAAHPVGLRRYHPRRGAITVLAAICSVVILGMVALSVDVGYILSMKEEMQRTADAAALAACWDYGKNLAEGNDSTTRAMPAIRSPRRAAVCDE